MFLRSTIPVQVFLELLLLAAGAQAQLRYDLPSETWAGSSATWEHQQYSAPPPRYAPMVRPYASEATGARESWPAAQKPYGIDNGYPPIGGRQHEEWSFLPGVTASRPGETYSHPNPVEGVYIGATNHNVNVAPTAEIQEASLDNLFAESGISPAAKAIPESDQNGVRSGGQENDSTEKQTPKQKSDDEEPQYFSFGYPSRLWTCDAAVVGLKRRGANHLPLISGQSTLSTMVDATDLAFDYELGVRVRVIRNAGCGPCWEIGYLGIPSWSEEATVVGDLCLHGPGFDLGVNPSIFVVRCNSSLHSAEINWVRTDFSGRKWFAGFRYVRFNDGLTVSELVAPFENALQVRSGNDLFGLLLGADFCIYNHAGPLRIEASTKLGIYGNSARQDIRSSVLGPPITSSASEAAFSGELEITLSYQLANHIEIRGGYQLLGLGGVALAPDQIPGSDLSTGWATVQFNRLLVEGGFVGVRLSW
ncbi:MAG TPA: hypothetical protein VMY42_19830 [Thermoguttaceae bacterium]|nr:hypothetical protein [Thermoguttaceae bacterium]